MKTVLVERYATLGGVCLNVGCIPSKALLHTAAVDGRSRRRSASTASATARRRSISHKLRGFKEERGQEADRRPGRHGQGAQGRSRARRRAASSIRITSKCSSRRGSGQDKTGEKKVVRFQKAIIAAGSQAVKLPFMPDDPRVVDSTGALLLDVDSQSACW